MKPSKSKDAFAQAVWDHPEVLHPKIAAELFRHRGPLP